MANRSSDGAERSAAIASLERVQALMRQTLAGGKVPLDEEIRLRIQVADMFIKTSDQLQHQQFVHDAVENLEVVLRKVPQTSPDYPKYLDSLSQARTSEYMITGSLHALDLAVQAAREALELAVANDLQTHDFEAQSSIISNLAFALSRRHASSRDIDDLDEAIVYTRMVYEGAAKDSDRRFMSLNNLVSQLRRRIEQVHNDDLAEEAETLLRELATSTTPGTLQNGIANGQLGFITFKKFKSTNSLEDLDKALQLCKIGFEALPPNHEIRMDMLITIVDLYSSRRNLKKDAVDLKPLVRYSELLLEALPAGHRSRGEHLSEYAGRVKEYVESTSSLEDIDIGIRQISKHLSTMSVELPWKKTCQNILSDLLGMRYKLTTDIQDLIVLTDYLGATVTEQNANAGKPGSSKPPISAEWIWVLKSHLCRIRKGSDENTVKDFAQQELAAIFLSLYEPDKTAVVVLDEVYQNYGVRLNVIADAIGAFQTLSEDEISIRTERPKNEKDASRSTNVQPLVLGNREYEAFGSRKLAIDPETGDIMWDFNRDMMKEVLGYEPKEPLSLTKREFIIRETWAEQRAIDKARSEGRQPNLDLCRMCRDIAKPLQRIQDDYQLTAKNIYLPFGNFHQLYCRRYCIICRLIFSAITTETEELHPQLEAIDKEVQGTSLLTGILSTGEKVMRIEYGLKHVGDIRLVTPQNYHQAIRQAREITDQPSFEEAIRSRTGPIYSHTGQQVDPMLIKSWLNDCDCNPGPICNGARVHSIGDEMTMLFIDVVENCLVAATSREKYFALSYVWGHVDMFKTTKDNCQVRQEPRALSAITFPKTIRDAIRLVKSLGERLLWVDAICMVQDDKEQMDRDIPKMNIVYGRAFATIVALYGDSADAGLPGVSAGTRRPQLIEYLRVSGESPNLDYDPRDDKNKTICLTVTPRPLALELDIAKWNTRGWVFQERLLSRRCLYFSPSAVYLQCASKTLSEGGANEEYIPKTLDSVPQKPRVTSRRAARDNALDLMNFLQDVTSEEERVIKAFGIYKGMVESYTRREFSFKADVLNGFAGVFAVLEKYFKSKTYAGLPAAVLAHALLWAPAGRLSRRGMRLPKPSNLSMGKPDMQFPSWSWAGWDGPVEYRLFKGVEGNLHLPTSLFTDFEIGKAPTENTITKTDVSKPNTETSGNTFVEASTHVQPDSAGLPGDSIRDNRIASLKGKEVAIHSESNEIRTATKLVADPSRGTTWTVAPPQPLDPWDPPFESNIVRFTAPTIPSSAFRISPEKEYLIQQPHVHIQGQQAVRRIYDRQGNHCGLWWEQAGYGYVGHSLDPRAESRIHMVGISTYRNVDRPLEGPSRVEGEIRLFDSKAFPAVGPNSGLVHVLVVDADLEKRDEVGYRVTVAVVHVEAWEKAGPRESDLQLA
ncbi:heterokaryon incompatibility protein-domain-containing protein [Hypoxylon cercidicola]|nr:heterokaryon incompatibility protein-domain-containing protein [Hypoxylon cercidicola]